MYRIKTKKEIVDEFGSVSSFYKSTVSGWCGEMNNLFGLHVSDISVGRVSRMMSDGDKNSTVSSIIFDGYSGVTVWAFDKTMFTRIDSINTEPSIFD